MVDPGMGMFDLEWRGVSCTGPSFRVSGHRVTLLQCLCATISGRFPLCLVARPCHCGILCVIHLKLIIWLRVRENGIRKLEAF
jgi:hypothetical protein